MFTLQALDNQRPKTVCLNMIVKDEKDVILKSLATVKHLIDYWVIVDTGSKDGTQELIKNFMKDIPGELHERPWVDFAHNRNEAMTLAKGKGDYLLFIDADEELVYTKEFRKPKLDKDYYFIIVRQAENECRRVFMIDTHLNWKWKGVLHEELVCEEAQSFETVAGVIDMAVSREGNRSRDPDKFLKDAAVLEKALQDEPTNARYAIFLAQTYLCAQKYALALKNYEKRVAMGGREEEVFWSLYSIGLMQEKLGMPQEQIVSSYSKAYHYRPIRVESLFALARYFYGLENYILAYALSKEAMTIPIPSDVVYVVYPIYHYKRQFLHASSAFQLGKYDEAMTLFGQLASNKTLPSEVQREAEQNVGIIKSLQAQQKAEQPAM